MTQMRKRENLRSERAKGPPFSSLCLCSSKKKFNWQRCSTEFSSSGERERERERRRR
jgi:hypothetical protein